MNYANEESEIRRQLVKYHRMLMSQGLVAWTSGNISFNFSARNQMFIKPSGVLYEDLKQFNIARVDMDGICFSESNPSTDTDTHLFVYNNWVGPNKPSSIVHTHSPYATAFAVVAQPIPCVLTNVACEFGGDVPCGNYAPIGGADIGGEILRLWDEHKCPAMLMANHGVFTIGSTIEEAVKRAVMLEDCAKTIILSNGVPGIHGARRLSDDEIAQLHTMYTTVYGQ